MNIWLVTKNKLKFIGSNLLSCLRVYKKEPTVLLVLYSLLPSQLGL